MAKLSDEKIRLIREVYARIGTYSGTAKEVGCSPASVKKYVAAVTPVSIPTQEKKVKPFNKNIPSIEEIGEVKVSDELMRLTYFEKEESVIFQQEEL